MELIAKQKICLYRSVISGDLMIFQMKQRPFCVSMNTGRFDSCVIETTVSYLWGFWFVSFFVLQPCVSDSWASQSQ